MSLPVPNALKQGETKQVVQGGLAVEPLRFHELTLGRLKVEYAFRPTHFVLHVFSEHGPFPLNFGTKLNRLIYGGWPGAKEVKVEWIEELRSFCVRVYQQPPIADWGPDQVKELLTQGLGS